jgi:two-component system, OmpR family, response regulator MprA
MRLLVIDDEPAVRKSMEMIAAIAGWETFACDQFADAERMIRDNSIDVLLCDYLMPPTTGLEVIQRIRHAGLSLPIVMISANPARMDATAIRELNVREILCKPPDVKDARRALAEAAAEAACVQ